jgi:hypothetical protein
LFQIESTRVEKPKVAKGQEREGKATSKHGKQSCEPSDCHILKNSLSISRIDKGGRYSENALMRLEQPP